MEKLDITQESKSVHEPRLWYHSVRELPEHIIIASINAFTIIDDTFAFIANVFYYDGQFYLMMQIDMFNNNVFDEPTLRQSIINKEIIYCGIKNRDLYFIVNVKFVRGLIRFLQKIVKILKIGHWSVEGKHYDLYEEKQGQTKTDEELESLIENFALKFPEAPLYKQAKKK
jgi:hypothetical protein